MNRPVSRLTAAILGAVVLGAGAGWLGGHAQRRRLHRELTAARWEAVRDPLTGLLNRRGLDQAASRLEASSILALLDVDGLKAINDTCGHAVGDIVLRTVADRLTHRVGGLGPVVRLGGDEFAVVMTGYDTHEGTEIAQKVHSWLAAPILIGRRPIRVTCSIGLAQVSRATTAQALRAADLAMYRAKTTGIRVGVYCAAIDGPATISPRPSRRVRDSPAGRLQLAALPA